MTATDKLRRLLTERNIEWRYADERTTYWYGTLDGREWGEWTVIEHGGLLHVTFDSGDFVTPEEAIAATLGDGEYESKMDALLCQLTNGKWSMTRKYSLEFMESLVRDEFEEAFAAESVTEDTYTREDVEGAFVSGYSLGLDMFDSSKSDDEKGWNQNERNLDEEMAELGWVRDMGTCHAYETETVKCSREDATIYHGRWFFGAPLTVHVMECSECGHTYEHVNGSHEFCPRCGRRVEVDE